MFANTHITSARAPTSTRQTDLTEPHSGKINQIRPIIHISQRGTKPLAGNIKHSKHIRCIEGRHSFPHVNSISMESPPSSRPTRPLLHPTPSPEHVTRSHKRKIHGSPHAGHMLGFHTHGADAHRRRRASQSRQVSRVWTAGGPESILVNGLIEPRSHRG